jgi:hypothetical protein
MNVPMAHPIVGLARDAILGTTGGSTSVVESRAFIDEMAGRLDLP